jgi:hypothetical protein
MKTILNLLLLFIVTQIAAQDAFYRFQWFGSIGQAIPVGAFSADNNSSNPMETGIQAPIGQSYRIGFDFYPVRHFGITAGSAIMDFNIDEETFKKMHHTNPKMGESYINTYHQATKTDHQTNRIMFGFTSRFTTHRFSIEPKLTVGVITPLYMDAEYYQKSAAGDIYKTYSYNYTSTSDSDGFWGCLNGAVNINFNVLQKGDNPALAVFFFSEFTFLNPKIVETKTISDSYADTVITTETTFRQHFSFFYYGFGIMLKHGWFTSNTD